MQPVRHDAALSSAVQPRQGFTIWRLPVFDLRWMRRLLEFSKIKRLAPYSRPFTPKQWLSRERVVASLSERPEDAERMATGFMRALCWRSSDGRGGPTHRTAGTAPCHLSAWARMPMSTRVLGLPLEHPQRWATQLSWGSTELLEPMANPANPRAQLRPLIGHLKSAACAAR